MKYIIGTDEVGLGAWSGSLVVCSVVFLMRRDLSKGPVVGLRDSKKLSHPRRMELSDKIKNEAAYWVMAQSNAKTIDKYGIQKCKIACMRKCIEKCREKFPEALVIIDGIDPVPGILNLRTMIKADDKVAAVSAASILAKTYRDRLMTKIGYKYPRYGFEKNKGYGTKTHREALNKFGICPEHRKSYKPIQEILTRIK